MMCSAIIPPLYPEMLQPTHRALNPAIPEMVAEAKAKFRPVPDTFIPSDRFNALIDRLKEINEQDDEARDKAIQFALLDVGRIAPESSRSYYE